MFSANGTIPSAWTPTDGPNETDFALSPILSPLEAHKADLVVISGLEQKGGGGDGHQNGMGGMLTGQMLNSGPFAGVGRGPGGLADRAVRRSAHRRRRWRCRPSCARSSSASRSARRTTGGG